MSRIESARGSLSSECCVHTSLTGVALNILAIETSGRLVMTNLSGAEYWAVAIEMARKRIFRSSWFRHSSRPSMMTTVGHDTPCSESCCRGSKTSFLSWHTNGRWNIWGSLSIVAAIKGRESGTESVMLYARVAMMDFMWFRGGSEREKKKVASSCSRDSRSSAMAWAIADFPAPAVPYNHIITVLSSIMRLTQSLIFSGTVTSPIEMRIRSFMNPTHQTRM